MNCPNCNRQLGYFNDGEQEFLYCSFCHDNMYSIDKPYNIIGKFVASLKELTHDT